MSTTTVSADAIRTVITENLPFTSPYHIQHYTPTKAADDPILHACFSLIEETSSAAYAASSKGWRPKAKQREMREEGMHYLLLLPNPSPASSLPQSQPQSQSQPPHSQPPQPSQSPSSQSPSSQSPLSSSPDIPPSSLAPHLLGFLSFQLTLDDNLPVLYIYEIHLSYSVRGQGLGKTLMHCADVIGRRTGMQKAMLTVFVSNVAAIGFYEGLGFEKWDEEYIPPRTTRRLRSKRKLGGKGEGEEGEEGGRRKASYIIMAKDLVDGESTVLNGEDSHKTESDKPEDDGWETDG